MKIKSALLPLSLIAFSAFSTASEENTYITSTPALDGDVNSSWAVDTFSNDLTIGNTGTFFPNNHKAILTFNTALIEQGKTVQSAHAVLTFSSTPAGMDISDLYEYIDNNMAIGVAGPFGFGGSHAITALDYYAVPIASINADDFGFGWFVEFDIDLTDHVNPYGQTQIMISFVNNPENISVSFKSGDVGSGFPNNYNSEPLLVVSYE